MSSKVDESQVKGKAHVVIVGGFKKLEDLEVDFTSLKEKYGVNIVHQSVVEIDAAGKNITLDNRQR
ncbi:MAG: hypothetical protein ACP5F0_07415 [Sulfurihydrogenibium sp.]